MKNLLLALVIVFLCALPAFAQKPDLEGAMVLHQGRCTDDGKPMVCFLVAKDNVLYVAAHDGRGQAKIYRVKEMPKDGEIDESKHLELLWSRDSV